MSNSTNGSSRARRKSLSGITEGKQSLIGVVDTSLPGGDMDVQAFTSPGSIRKKGGGGGGSKGDDCTSGRSIGGRGLIEEGGGGDDVSDASGGDESRMGGSW